MAKKVIIPIQTISPIEMVNLNKYTKLFLGRVLFEPIQDQHYKYIGFRLKSDKKVDNKDINQLTNAFRLRFNKELSFEQSSNGLMFTYCGSVLK